VREFASLFFVAALAARLGSAGAPSSVPVTRCEADQRATSGVPAHVSGGAVGISPVEDPSTGADPTGGSTMRRSRHGTAHTGVRMESAVRASDTPRSAPSSLMGFSGHPSTAPPQRI